MCVVVISRFKMTRWIRILFVSTFLLKNDIVLMITAFIKTIA